MPDKGTLDEILGVPAGGKENYSMDPALREQEGAASDAVGAGKENTGTDPALRTAQGTGRIETISQPASALPAAKAEVQNKPGLVQTAPQDEEGERLKRILVALGYDEQETPEQKAKREKTEKWEKAISAIGDGISAMAGLHFAAQTGISNYSPEHSMSAKTRARWDKLNADRKANQKAYADAYLRLKGMEDQNAHWREEMKMRQEQYVQQQANWEKQFDYQKEKDDKAWDRLLANDAQAQDNWQKAFDQKAEQLKFENSMAKKNYTLSRQRLAAQGGNDVEFLIGDNEKISIPKASLNAANITYVFNTLPENVRNQTRGQAILTNYGGVVRDENNQPMYKPLSSDEMLTVIFANIGGSTATQNALRQLAGQKTDRVETDKNIDW